MNAAPLPACVLLAATLALSAVARADDAGQDLAQRSGKSLIGTPAPPLKLKTIDGKTLDLGKLYGKQAVYLKFWATWCVPCREQMPHFERTWREAGPDLAVIGVNAGFNDTLADVKEYQRTVGITMPQVLDDGTVGAAFHLRVTPQHVVIGRDGRVLYIGHLADERLEQALKAARTVRVANEAGSVRLPAPARARYSIGDLLPAAPEHSVDGRVLRLREPLDPRPSALLFLSPCCESYLATSRPQIAANCRQAREIVDAVSRDGHVRWIGIASGLWATDDDLRAYQKKHAFGIPLVLDEAGATFRAFGVREVPTVFLADASGRLTRRLDAAVLNDAAQFRRELDASVPARRATP